MKKKNCVKRPALGVGKTKETAKIYERDEGRAQALSRIQPPVLSYS